MGKPGDCLPNPKEARLADLVWAKAAELMKSGYSLHPTHAPFEQPWVSKQILYARDWITDQREFGDVNSALGGEVFTSTEIANVEHFYCAALLGSIGGPAGGIILGGIASAAWDLVISPVRKGIQKGGLPSLSDLKYDLKQYAVYDAQGTWFGSMHKVKGGN